jgi:hypothetical protein
MPSVVSCPECGSSATVLDRCVLESTDGPVELVRILCAAGHYFFMPSAGLASRVRMEVAS